MTTRDWNPFLRFPGWSLALTGLGCLPLLLGLPRLAINAETQALLSGDQRNLASYRQVRDILGDSEAVAISLTLTNLFTEEGLETVRALSEAFERQPEVIEVKSLTHAVRPVRRGLGFEMVPLVPPSPLDAAKLAELRGFCESHPLVRNLMVSADGRHTLVTAHFGRQAITPEEQAQFRQRLDATLAPFRAAGFELRVLALPLIEEEIRATLRRDLTRFVPAAAGVVVGVLWLAFRSVRLMLFALLNQVGVLVLLPGIVQLTGYRLNVFSVALAPLITGIHLTLLMHLLTAVQRASAHGLGIEPALRSALGVVARPAFLSTLTTVLGLLSLGTSDLEQVVDFGRLGAICLVAVHAATFGPTIALLKLGGRVLDLAGGARFRTWPSALRFIGSVRSLLDLRRGHEPGGARLRRARHRASAEWLGGASPHRNHRFPGSPAAPETVPFAARLVAFSVRRRATILMSAGLAALVATGGLALLRTDVRMIEMLPARSPTRQALEELDRAYGGINVVQIAFDSGRTNGMNEPAFLKYLDQVQRFAEAQPEPTGVFSYAQLLAMVNQIWEGGRPEALRLPDNPWLVALFSTAIRSYGFPFLATLADAGFRETQLVVRTRDMPARDYLGLIGRIVAYADAHKPPEVTVSATQGIHSILEADRRILRSQCSSVGWAVGVIALALALLWRSGRLALLGMVTNTVPVALALAMAGYAQVPLNSINVMVGALALGIAQDDTIHFVTHWRDAVRAGRSSLAALQDTFEVKGRPIIWTTVILVGVFALFGLSSFPPVVQFGLLLAGAFVAAQVSLLLFLPAWLARQTVSARREAGQAIRDET